VIENEKAKAVINKG